MATFRSYLTSGPLMTTLERRRTTIEAMATLLVAADAFADRGDAIRLLMANDYPATDIFILIDEARQAAMVEIVAREMSEP